MGQALYRSYRSRSFDEVVGQDHITNTLKRAIASGRISHAYLFTGPRGVGKTSVARILAHQVNNLPYTGEDIHLDIIEIDAASNRRIDEIRDLREKVHISPTSSKYKVYIIDEVHMLTREAFNALLKTLEEPPAHCIFILATTESHKLPETIISRTQRFNFKSIDSSQAVTHLNKIAKKEKIDIDKAALELVAEYGEGSFRDSISLLDQLSSVSTKITPDDVRKQLGIPTDQAVLRIVGLIDEKKPSELLGLLTSLRDQAIDSPMLAKSVSKVLRNRIANNQAALKDFELLKNLLEIPASSQPSEVLEIVLLEASYPQAESIDGLADSQTDRDDSPTKTSVITKTDEVKVPSPETSKNDPELEPAKIKSIKLNTESKTLDTSSLDEWDKIMEGVKDRAASLYTALRLARPVLVESDLYLYFEFPLHQKKLNQATNKDILDKMIHSLTGRKLIIHCLIEESKSSKNTPKLKVTASSSADPQNLAAISNIFGSAEVLES
jgi:DNA polymerase III subunit gamma/tau